jgi:hypothetical protein
MDRYGRASNAVEAAVILQNSTKRMARDCISVTFTRSRIDNASAVLEFRRLSAYGKQVLPSCAAATGAVGFSLPLPDPGKIVSLRIIGAADKSPPQ